MAHPCPSCQNTTTRVRPGYSRHNPDGSTTRRRFCHKCGVKFVTHQPSAKAPEALTRLLTSAETAATKRDLARRRQLIQDLVLDVKMTGRWSPENRERIKKEFFE